MSRTIIASNPGFKRKNIEKPFIDIAEFFSKTIQGEGINTGVPSIFLRMQGCTLNCVWCDTVQVWKVGNRYRVDEMLDLMKENEVVEDLKNGHHLVLTGGSPVLQQDRLIVFINEFIAKFGFKPYIEIENECTLMPKPELVKMINCWNNSPKLENNGMAKKFRHKPEIIKYISQLNNSWFKFVITCKEDWDEIKKDFLDTGIVKKEQILLMPCGENQEELSNTREIAIQTSIENNVRFTDRIHIVAWDKKTGV